MGEQTCANGNHVPDGSTVAYVDTESPQGTFIVDVACKHCGYYGSVLIQTADVLWDLED
jgi:hypothetical protein